jgi:DNA repair exonuclease SbcCD ATPase subunit
MSEGRIRVYGRRLSNREIADLLPLSAERQRERDMLVEEQNLLKQCLSAMPVGYIPTHTAENLPEMIGDLAKALAEETTERENLERELTEALSDLEFRRDLFKLQEQQLNNVRAERDRMAAIARELTAMIRVNVMWGRFAECSVEQIDEHLKPWNEKIAAVKGGSDE